MRCLLLLALAACGSDDLDADEWAWRFVDPETSREVACPPIVDRVAVAVFQARLLGGECLSTSR